MRLTPASSAVDHADRFVVVAVAHRAEHHRPERDLPDGDAGPAVLYCMSVPSLLVRP
jgi:hypothetical protein